MKMRRAMLALAALLLDSTTAWTTVPRSVITTTPPAIIPHGGAAMMPTAIPPEIVTSFVPPLACMFLRYDYIVSYGYGGALALTGIVLHAVAPLQSAILTLYGVRLCLFLLARNLFSQRMQEMQQRIEAKALARNSDDTSWLQRKLKLLPLAVSCGYLYYGLSAPLLLQSTTNVATQICAAGTALGFAIAALGDTTKSWVKRNDPDALVTSGIYSVLRHPNYTGEIIGWTMNCAAGVAGAIHGNLRRGALAWYMTSSVLGWLGIVFVLMQATGGLEQRQKEKYGDRAEYKEWIDKTWSGWMVAKKETPPVIKVSDTVEEGGTGI
uniref:Steroid 5-alpha reductase C-terminal domain-containing protein n=1 Tax=Craspedostauros australis TaxID=1486917 RepID=A0A7R9WXV5_9STRA